MIKVQASQQQNKDKVIGDFISMIIDDSDYKEYFEDIAKKQERLDNFLTKGRSANANINQLVVLRQWNSYTPILPDHNSKYNCGGGYFLYFNGFGFVIDPGYNFIENFLNAGFKLDDIDAVFVTHAHDDHTVQLEAIFSLLFKRNKRFNKVNKEGDDSKRDPKKIDLYLNLGTFKKFAGFFDLSDPAPNYYINHIFILNELQFTNINKSISLFTTRTQHHEMITSDYSLGLTFVLDYGSQSKNKIIKFTSDTGWNTKNEEINKNSGLEYRIDEPDILISHIGSIKKCELEYKPELTLEQNEKETFTNEEGESERILYKYHLGLIGTIAEILYWSPQLTLISEFGKELSSVRTRITKHLSDTLKKTIYPVDINFRINLDDFSIRSHKSKNFVPFANIRYEKQDSGSIVYFNEDEVLNDMNSVLRVERKDEWNKIINGIRIFDE